MSSSRYAVRMEFLTGPLFVICGEQAARGQMSALAAELALRGPLTVLDGGNRFAPYQVVHLLRQKTVEVAAASKRLFIRRAFTCYQMVALLENTPALNQPYLILDLLASFYDDQVWVPEARRLLDLCLLHIDRLRTNAPIAISLTPTLLDERDFLMESVCEQADQVVWLESSKPVSRQLLLF